jgi:hypothetical protein
MQQQDKYAIAFDGDMTVRAWTVKDLFVQTFKYPCNRFRFSKKEGP